MGKRDLPWGAGEGQPGRASGQPIMSTRLSKADGMQNGLFMDCREGNCLHPVWCEALEGKQGLRHVLSGRH